MHYAVRGSLPRKRILSICSCYSGTSALPATSSFILPGIPRYNIYGDGSNTELKLCKVCHKKDGHANDCEYGKKSVDNMVDYSRKLKLKTNNKDGKPCKWYLLGLSTMPVSNTMQAAT